MLFGVHSAVIEGVGLPTPLLAVVQLFLCDQRPCLAGQEKSERCCTNHPYLPTCKAKADGLGLRRRNQASLHVLYAS